MPGRLPVDENSPEWHLGNGAEVRWANHLKAIGAGLVLPLFHLKPIVPETDAPMLLHRDGPVLSPDILLTRPDKKGHQWHEVKGKSAPSWNRKHSRWECGIDFTYMEEYERIEQISGIELVVVVFEERSPLDRNSYSKLLEGPEAWHWVKLSEIKKPVGEHRNWPDTESENSRDGKGGWLWPRNEMHEVKKGVR